MACAIKHIDGVRVTAIAREIYHIVVRGAFMQVRRLYLAVAAEKVDGLARHRSALPLATLWGRQGFDVDASQNA